MGLGSLGDLSSRATSSSLNLAKLEGSTGTLHIT